MAPKPYFHKLILYNSVKHKKLKIPCNFVKKFGHDLSAFGGVSVPGGPMWPVGLIKADDNFWFNEGWPEFMERYSISVGYFLIFRYEGNAVFTVHIFNLMNSEINYQSKKLAGRRCLAFEEIEDEEFIENLSSPSCFFLSSTKSKVYDERLDQMTVTKSGNTTELQNLFNESEFVQLSKGDGVSNAADVQFNAVERKQSVVDIKFDSPDGETQKNPKKRGKKRVRVDTYQSRTTQQEDDGDTEFRIYESASARVRAVTDEERERALNAAKAFKRINPFCRVVLRPSYLYKSCIMYLPSCFAEKNLKGVCGFIKLQLSDGEPWPVRCHYRGGIAKLSVGWYEFTLKNKMGEGDVCVFELLKSRDIRLKVTVFRVHEGRAGKLRN